MVAAASFPDAEDYERFRWVCDYTAFFWVFDDILDDRVLKENPKAAKATLEGLRRMMHDSKGTQFDAIPLKLARDIWERLCKLASPGAKRRYIETIELYIDSTLKQAPQNDPSIVHTIEEYIKIRRGNGSYNYWVATEVALALDLPDDVMQDPALKRLGDIANDMTTWSNDLYSYNRDQASGDSYNLVAVAMKELNLDVQGGIDYVGDRIKAEIDQFIAQKAKLPSWGPEIDRQVDAYARGIQNAVICSSVWSLSTPRYFGDEYEEVKRTLCVTLWPKVV